MAEYKGHCPWCDIEIIFKQTHGLMPYDYDADCPLCDRHINYKRIDCIPYDEREKRRINNDLG